MGNSRLSRRSPEAACRDRRRRAGRQIQRGDPHPPPRRHGALAVRQGRDGRRRRRRHPAAAWRLAGHHRPQDARGPAARAHGNPGSARGRGPRRGAGAGNPEPDRRRRRRGTRPGASGADGHRRGGRNRRGTVRRLPLHAARRQRRHRGPLRAVGRRARSLRGFPDAARHRGVGSDLRRPRPGALRRHPGRSALWPARAVPRHAAGPPADTELPRGAGRLPLRRGARRIVLRPRRSRRIHRAGRTHHRGHRGTGGDRHRQCAAVPHEAAGSRRPPARRGRAAGAERHPGAARARTHAATGGKSGGAARERTPLPPAGRVSPRLRDLPDRRHRHGRQMEPGRRTAQRLHGGRNRRPEFRLPLHPRRPGARRAGAADCQCNICRAARGRRLAGAQGRQPVLGQCHPACDPRRTGPAAGFCQDHPRPD